LVKPDERLVPISFVEGYSPANGSGVIVNVVGAGAIGKIPNYIGGVTGNAPLEPFTRSLGQHGPRRTAGVRDLPPVISGSFQRQAELEGQHVDGFIDSIEIYQLCQS
jgi:hypothetical protein